MSGHCEVDAEVPEIKSASLQLEEKRHLLKRAP